MNMHMNKGTCVHCEAEKSCTSHTSVLHGGENERVEVLADKKDVSCGINAIAGLPLKRLGSSEIITSRFCYVYTEPKHFGRFPVRKIDEYSYRVANLHVGRPLTDHEKLTKIGAKREQTSEFEGDPSSNVRRTNFEAPTHLPLRCSTVATEARSLIEYIHSKCGPMLFDFDVYNGLKKREMYASNASTQE
jgi:hypothetical protein